MPKPSGWPVVFPGRVGGGDVRCGDVAPDVIWLAARRDEVM